MTVPLSVTFEEAGLKRLTAHVVVRSDSDGLRSYEYPVYVDVEEPDGALLSVSTSGEVAAGEETPVNVTVSNAESEALSGVQLDLTASGTVENAGRVRASVPAGTDHTFRYDVTFGEAGTGSLTAELTYETSAGTSRSVTESFDVDVAEPVVRAGLSASSPPDSPDTAAVELTNFGNVALSDVEVTAVDGDGDVVARAPLSTVEPGSSRSASLDTGSRTDEALTFTASYEAAGRSGTTSVTRNVAAEVPGEVRLTGVEVTRDGTAVRLDGEAANVGSTDVESVLVSVRDTDAVSPAPPSGEYFVGAIDASEFATFELAADAGTGTSAIPVEVTYIVGGERVTTTQRLAVDSGGASAGDPSGGNGEGDSDGSPDSGDPSDGPPLTLIGGVLVLVLLAALGVYRWRRQ